MATPTVSFSQFGPQPVLPGTERLGPTRPTRRPITPPGPGPGGQWSGPIRGQTTLGPVDLADKRTAGPHKANSRGNLVAPVEPFEVDDHGFVSEIASDGRIYPQKVDRGGTAAKKFYGTHGGKMARTASEHYPDPEQFDALPPGFAEDHDAKVAEVRNHWESVPTTRVRSDTPVHTAQSTWETSMLGDQYAYAPGWAPEGHEFAGDKRVRAIREDLESGNDIREPAWMVRRGGRLMSLDGHHRILAARQAGLESYPAKVWDVDAEAKQ